MLLPEISTPNIYEHYRHNPWEDEPTPGRRRSGRARGAAGPVGAHRGRGVLPRRHRRSASSTAPTRSKGSVFDYHRADGSTYLRSRVRVQGAGDLAERPPAGRAGRLGLGEFKSVGQWFKRFVRHLAATSGRFLFVDSRFSVQHLVPMRAKNVHVVYVLHNIHVAPPRLWSSRALRHLRPAGRQGRRHRRVRHADRPSAGRHRAAPRPHRPTCSSCPTRSTCPSRPRTCRPATRNRVTVVARLEKQKRLGHAIRAFALAAQRVPAARLDIYGSGSQMPVLERARRQARRRRRRSPCTGTTRAPATRCGTPARS